MKLSKFEVATLPKNPVSHNFGDKFGLVKFDDSLAETYTDEIAHLACDAGLPYFKPKAESKAVADVKQIAGK
jgi:hypothetical protein